MPSVNVPSSHGFNELAAGSLSAHRQRVNAPRRSVRIGQRGRARCDIGGPGRDRSPGTSQALLTTLMATRPSLKRAWEMDGDAGALADVQRSGGPGVDEQRLQELDRAVLAGRISPRRWRPGSLRAGERRRRHALRDARQDRSSALTRRRRRVISPRHAALGAASGCGPAARRRPPRPGDGVALVPPTCS